MVSVVDVIGLLVVVSVNTVVAALMTRFFRDRLHTRWGSLLYTLTLTPLVLILLVFLFSGVAGLGPNLGSAGAVIGVTILLPLSLGIAFDYFWMPAPEEVELPERYQA